ncbi:MAG: TIGR02677 family protein [Kineosporiaceae bacterium]
MTPETRPDTSAAESRQAPARLRLEALRYATTGEAAQYLAVVRVFADGTAGLMSDLSAAEVADRLGADHGLDLDVDTVEERLRYLVEHGNLARSPREARARSIAEYLATRTRYQLTPRGELAHRLVEQFLADGDAAREVSTEMLPPILAALVDLRDTATALAAGGAPPDPQELAARIGTLFAQFERLVGSTRAFYTYLNEVLSRYDLDRGEFQAFKSMLVDYLQGFIDDVARHMPQIADVLRDLLPHVPALVAAADRGTRLTDVSGARARRAAGLSEADWDGPVAWFLGSGARDSDADQVRRLATAAMRGLVVNLRRIAAAGTTDVSRAGDLLRLAGWFHRADDDTAHALWCAAFGLYPARHLGFAAPDDDTPATASWWRAPVAEVPVALRVRGERRIAGRTARRADFTAAKGRRLAQRAEVERQRATAVAELAAVAGPIDGVRLSVAARDLLLEMHARATADASPRAARYQGADPAGLEIVVTRSVGARTRSPSDAGELVFVGSQVAAVPTSGPGGGGDP